MIVGALKSQDEYGYPASVTIAQIIQESGYGTYGPGGNKGQGLSGLAYGYCNLFVISDVRIETLPAVPEPLMPNKLQ